MERDKDLFFRLIDFLITHGYPQESLMMDWLIGHKYRVDLAVIDPDSNKAIALFELKRKKTSKSLKMAMRQLSVFSEALGDEQIPTYVVFGTKEYPFFEIYYLKKDSLRGNKEQALKIDKIPDYSIFENRKFQQIIGQTEEKRKKTITAFQIMCWIAAGVVTILLLLDFFNILNITTERLALIGVIIALIIIPFANRLKISGIEFERLKESKEKKGK